PRVRDRLAGVAGEQDTPALRARRPHGDAAAGEVAAGLQRPDARQHVERLGPGADLAVLAPPAHPFPVGRGDVDGSAEGAGPRQLAAVHVRVAGHHRSDPAEVSDRPDGRLVEIAGHLPEQVAVRGAHQHRALPDVGPRLGVQREAVLLDLGDLDAAATSGTLAQGGPALTAGGDVLPLVGADRTGVLVEVVLHPAGRA